MLKKIKIQSNFIYFDRIKSSNKTESFEISFNAGVNIITSPNGSGKTTILESLQERFFESKHLDTIQIKTSYIKGQTPKHFLFLPINELKPKDQLRKISHLDTDFIDKTIAIAEKMSLSHGEQVFSILKDANTLLENVDVVFIDEPETALDLDNLLKFVENIKIASSQTQFIIVSHHPALFLQKDFNVIDFNNGQYLKSIVNSFKDMIS